MYFAAALFIAFLMTIYLVSKLANMLNAKNSDIGWIFTAFAIGTVLTAIVAVLFAIFDLGVNPYVPFIVMMVVPFSIAYKYVAKLSWGGAFTLNIASIAIGLLTTVAATVLSGESINETLNLLNTMAKQNTSIVKSSVGTAIVHPTSNNEQPTVVTDESTVSTEELEPEITELDLLPAKAVRDIKRKEKRVYVEPKFRVISINNAYSAVGKKIRIHRKNGNTITGGLKGIKGGDLVISRYTNRGSVVMPISANKIHKLEVYK